jgi:hypothetical protein
MNTMKNILYTLLGVLLMTVTSCMEVDNWDEPDVTARGRVIDSYTGENILTSQGDWGIRIWERTWTQSVPNSQTLSVKQDGTYTNTKLFGGTYDMLPYGGPFWPVDTVHDVVFGGIAEQDFTVTPYLQLTGFETSLDGLKLTLTCQIKAPIRDGLPNLIEIRPFVSFNQFTGATNTIDHPDFTGRVIPINLSWEAWMAKEHEPVGADTHTVRVGPIKVKAGYTYYVRIGANVNDANRKHNYTPIIKVVVPADAKDDPTVVPDNFFENATWPFRRADWDGNRWGNLDGPWLTNAAMRTRDGRGGYDGGWEGPASDKQSLGFERWGAGETAIVNGKLYQTFNLPKGTYKFTMSLVGDNPIISNGGSDPRYIVAAIGETLPDIENLATALGSINFAGLANSAETSIQFTIDTPQKVSAGFVVSFTGLEQNVRPSWLKLEKL